MQINPISFGYSWKVKTEWKKGNLPTVKKGFYGETLTQENISIEHLKPVSQGGKTKSSNLVLASKRKNEERGNDDLRDYIDIETVKGYLEQFDTVKFHTFNGKEYERQIINTLKSLGVHLNENS